MSDKSYLLKLVRNICEIEAIKKADLVEEIKDSHIIIDFYVFYKSIVSASKSATIEATIEGKCLGLYTVLFNSILPFINLST